MGGTFSCLPGCLPAKSRRVEREVPYTDDFVENPNFKSSSKYRKLSASLTKANDNGLVEEVTRELRIGEGNEGHSLGVEKKLPARKSPKARGLATVGVDEHPRGDDLYSCLRSVLNDSHLTSLAIFTSTVVGCFAGVFAMSGTIGALFYLLVLLVQLTGAVFSKRILVQSKRTGLVEPKRNVTKQGSNQMEITQPTHSDGASVLAETNGNVKPTAAKPVISGKKATAANPREGALAKLSDEWACEPRTNHKFPYIMNEHDAYPKEVEVLSGLGIRDKKVIAMKIDVYSVGFYINASQLKRMFGDKYESATRNDLKQPDCEIFDDVINSTNSVARTIRIVIQFSGLTSNMLVKAFDERLEKVMKEADESHVYSELRDGLSSIKLYPGRIILMRMTTDGYLIASSDGEILANSRSHILCKAVTDIYLGMDTASPTLKEDAATRLYDTLHSPSLQDEAPTFQSKGDSSKSQEELQKQKQLSSSQDCTLTGTWGVYESENHDEFLATLGISYLVRKIAVQLYTKDMKIIEQDGKDVSFTDFRNRRKGNPVLFKENSVIERKDRQGRELKDVAHWEDSLLVLKTEGYQHPLISKYWRESSNEMISETTVKDVTMRRKWRLLDD